ncbi:hypothetical protein A2U01_0116576, partial [Trifolium medium]|nr:hypothetical protein [Trifolium medium]
CNLRGVGGGDFGIDYDAVGCCEDEVDDASEE